MTELRRDGCCVVRGVLDDALISRLRLATDALIDAAPDDRKQAYGRQGINIAMDWQDESFIDLACGDGIRKALSGLGFDRPRFWSGFILCKEPAHPSLYWHQDWLYWDQPISREAEPAMVFVMVYLTDTKPENGCLRVIPGSHVRRNPLHDVLPAAHTEDTYHASDDAALFVTARDEIDVPVTVGDIVIGDSRLLHAAHANDTGARRTCMTLWYFPRYDDFDDRLRASVQQFLFRPYDGNDPRPYGLLPDYTGDAEPIPYNRTPTL